jgi:predicted adenylyl cyclase CyaB
VNANVEIKARARHPERLRALAEALADGPAQTLEQEDTFFRVARGRLKLRVFAKGRGEMIYYERTDEAGVRPCHYVISRTAEPETLKAALAGALGVAGVVRKTRRLYLTGQTRIHLDEVEGLGHFLELEFVLRPGQSAKEGHAVVRELLCRLEVPPEDLLDRAYVDLLSDGPRPTQGA